MGIVSLYRSGRLKVWQDVFNRALDDKAAPDLGDVVEGREPLYSNPDEFFARTYMTRSLENLIREVADALENREGGSIFLLTSLYGGGKTHAMIALYHAFTRPESLMKIDDRLAARVASVKPLVVAIDGTRKSLAPTPREPYSAGGFTIRTLWGMLAYRLGAYAWVMDLDRPEAHPPFVDTLIEILKEPKRPVLILIDEIMPHIYTVSRAEELKRYAENIIMFMGYLARAVERTPRVALLVSLQLERRGDEIVEEEIYAGLAARLYNELHRETTRVVTPVTPTDVVQILKKRIFQEIPEDEASRARELLYSVYKQYPELFGTESDWQYSIEEGRRVLSPKDTYPFHPKYIEVIQEFISRNRDLRRTRDAIRLTRKVVRRVLGGRGDPTFIMPWHVDLRDPDIRNLVLTESRREFRDVASRDIVDEDGRLGEVAGCSRPGLAYRVAVSILLKVYTYETFKIPLRTFPTLRDVALMTYDPETFSSDGLQPPDIKTTLDEMVTRLSHFNFQDGRYWFDPYIPITDLVERRASEILTGSQLPLYRALEGYARRLLLKRPRRGERSEWKPFLFDERRTYIIGYGDLAYMEGGIEDRPEHCLVVLVKPEDSISKDEVENIILKYRGGLRNYKNTIAVVLPRPGVDFGRLLSLAAKIEAARKVGEELREFFKGDEELLRIRREKLEQYRGEVEGNLTRELLFALTRVAYPKMEDGRDTVQYVTGTPLEAIIEQVESALEDPSTGPKLRRRISFEDLTTFLNRLLQWDIVNGDRPIEFGRILEVFYTNTAAPFTRRDVVEGAILEGLRNLAIGVRMGGEVYWKSLGGKEARLPDRLRDDAEILPLKLAARDFAERLLSREGQFPEEGKLRVVWYEVEYGGQRFRLRDLVDQPGWVEILKEGVVYERGDVIERGFVVNVQPSLVEVDEGGVVEVEVSVEPVGGYDSEVKLRVDEGAISPLSGRPPFTAKWRIGPLAAGRRAVKVVAEGDGYSREGILTVSVRSLEEEVTVKRLDLSHVEAKLTEICVRDLMYAQMALNRIAQLNAKAKVDLSVRISGSIVLNGSDVDAKLAELVIQRISDLSRFAPTEATVSIKIVEPLVLHAGGIASLSVLADKADFKLRIRRGAS
ncbi:MAG: DUF499 domain-containing protein [Thermofilaceae archaeon]